MYFAFTSKKQVSNGLLIGRPEANIFAFRAQALFTWIKAFESHLMYRTVTLRMKGKCTLLKSALSQQVLDSKFDTRSLILESFENRELSL